MSETFTHRPVLLDECIQALAIRPEGVYLDGTLGRAGHSREIARRLTTGPVSYTHLRWYVRARISMDQARLACGELQPLARSGAPAGEAAFLTAPMTEPQLRDRLAGVEVDSLFRVL